MSDGKSAIDFVPARVAVITISDTRSLETDESGALIVDRLETAKHDVIARRILLDEQAEISSFLKALIEGQTCDVIITTGGTGFSERDVTPEAVRPLANRVIPGFGELFRMLSYKEIGASTIQSRAFAAIAADTLLFCLPGSVGACALAMDKIILEQIDNTHKPCNFRSHRR